MPWGRFAPERDPPDPAAHSDRDYHRTVIIYRTGGPDNVNFHRRSRRMQTRVGVAPLAASRNIRRRSPKRVGSRSRKWRTARASILQWVRFVTRDRAAARAKWVFNAGPRISS